MLVSNETVFDLSAVNGTSLLLGSVNASASNTTANSSWFSNLSQSEKTNLLVWVIVTLTISLFGAINNLLILIITWPKASRPSSLNMLIFHFITVGLVVCLLSYPLICLEVLAVIYGHEIPASLCRFTLSTYTILVKVINWSDAAIALNRCIAFYFPHHYKQWSSNRMIARITMFTWFISAGPVISQEVGVGGLDITQPNGQCFYLYRGKLGQLYLSLAMTPYALAGVGALLLLWKSIRSSSTRRAVGRQPANPNNAAGLRRLVQEARKLRMAKVLLGMFVWSAICILPWAVISVNYPHLYVQYAKGVSLFWLRTSFVCQHALTPVCTCIA